MGLCRRVSTSQGRLVLQFGAARDSARGDRQAVFSFRRTGHATTGWPWPHRREGHHRPGEAGASSPVTAAWTAASGALCRRSPPAGAGIAWRDSRPHQGRRHRQGLALACLSAVAELTAEAIEGALTVVVVAVLLHRRACLPRQGLGCRQRRCLPPAELRFRTAAPYVAMHRFLHLRSVHAEDRAIQQVPHHRPWSPPQRPVRWSSELCWTAYPNRPPSASACSMARASAWPSSPRSSSPTSQGIQPARACASGRSVKASPRCGWPSLSSRRSRCRTRACSCSGAAGPCSPLSSLSLGWDRAGFAAGAVLAMLRDDDAPEAVDHAGRWVGLVTVLGVHPAAVPPRRRARPAALPEVGSAGRVGPRSRNRSTWSRPAPGHPQ